MNDEMLEVYFLNRIKKNKNGRIKIDCIKGLWGVSGPKEFEGSLERDAKHYFFQYYLDGEYD